MCNVNLAGSEGKYSHLNNVVILSDCIKAYDENNELIMTLPQGKKKRNDFEYFSYGVLNSLDSTLALLKFL